MFKRLSLSLLAIAMVALVASAATYALFTDATSNQSNTLTAGTVTLGTVTTNLVDISNVVPGDSGSDNYSVTYKGSLDAWEGLTTSLSGGLLTCDAANKFTVSISDGVKSYDPNTADQVIGKVSTGAATSLTISWSLPLGAGNTCQAQSAALSLQVRAVQAKNNTNAAGTGPVSWS